MIDIKNRPGYTVDEYPYPCIYKMVFGEDFYIGQTVNLKQRIRSHVQLLKSGRGNIPMTTAYESSGGKFYVEIVEDIKPEQDHLYMNQREDYYIRTLHPTLNGAPVANAISREEAEYYGFRKTHSKLFSPVREDLIGMTNLEAVKKHREKLMEFKIRPYIAEGQKIREYATAHGMSVQGLFLEAVREYMAKHKAPQK